MYPISEHGDAQNYSIKIRVPQHHEFVLTYRRSQSHGDGALLLGASKAETYSPVQLVPFRNYNWTVSKDEHLAFFLEAQAQV